jgi:hypothetical protein
VSATLVEWAERSEAHARTKAVAVHVGTALRAFAHPTLAIGPP